MGGFSREGLTEWWEKNTHLLNGRVSIQEVNEKEGQIVLLFDGEKKVTLSLPSSAGESFSVFGEDDTASMADWNSTMMEYCERHRRFLDEVLSTVINSFQCRFPPNRQQQEEREKFMITQTNSLQLHSSPMATERLLKDLRSFASSSLRHRLGITASPIDDNLYHWKVRFFDFEAGTGLAQDLQVLSTSSSLFGGHLSAIELEMKFPADYPFSPPFIRVLRPRFQFRTGHVTLGGSICMELLTKTGWSAGNDIESILIQIRSEMIQGGARLDLTNGQDYSEHEAHQNFTRVAQQHGWKT